MDDEFRAKHLFGILPPPSVSVSTWAAALKSRQVYVSVRGPAIRVSLHVYNDVVDLAAIVQVLREEIQ